MHETYREIEESHWWFVGRRNLIYGLFSRFGIRPSEKSILDVGCNTGMFVGDLQKKGFDAYGCDVSSEAIEFGTQRRVKNLRVISGPLLPIYKDNSFDVTICLDVLEHIEDDAQTLQEINRILKPGGLLFIMVPAFQFLWGLQDVVAHHFRRYNFDEIKKLTSDKPWMTVYKSYFNVFLFVPIYLVRLFQKVKKPKRSSDFELNTPFTNSILTKIFLAEIWCMKYFQYPFGVSLIVVLKKNA